MRWESGGEGEYTIESVVKPARGTDVVLHLRAPEDELLTGVKLRQILRRYSDHITIPILMKKDGSDEDEQVNQASALWTRAKSAITGEQYDEFYKHVAHDFEAPLAHVHSKVEGKQEYALLLFIPRARPLTCGTATIATASSSTCGASSSWTMRSTCCRPTCVSCAG